jgi:hypothetical protein
MKKNNQKAKSEMSFIIEKIKFLLYTEICMKEKNIHWDSIVTETNNVITGFELKIQLPNISNLNCPECRDNESWYGDDDIVYNCSICNPNAL